MRNHFWPITTEIIDLDVLMCFMYTPCILSRFLSTRLKIDSAYGFSLLQGLMRDHFWQIKIWILSSFPNPSWRRGSCAQAIWTVHRTLILRICLALHCGYGPHRKQSPEKNSGTLHWVLLGQQLCFGAAVLSGLVPR
jgi:hypothetical protein